MLVPLLDQLSEFVADLAVRLRQLGPRCGDGEQVADAGNLIQPFRSCGIDRQRVWPSDGRGPLTASDPSPRSAQNEARRDPSRFKRNTATSWPAGEQPGSGINKEHTRQPPGVLRKSGRQQSAGSLNRATTAARCLFLADRSSRSQPPPLGRPCGRRCAMASPAWTRRPLARGSTPTRKMDRTRNAMK